MSVEASAQRDSGPINRAWRALVGLVPGMTHRRETPTIGTFSSLNLDVEPSAESLQLLRADLVGVIPYGTRLDSTLVLALIVADVWTTYATGEINEEGNIGNIAVYNPGIHLPNHRPEIARYYSDVIPESGNPYLRAHFDGGVREVVGWDQSEKGFAGRFRALQNMLKESFIYTPTENDARRFLERIQNPSRIARALSTEGRLQTLGLQYSRA